MQKIDSLPSEKSGFWFYAGLTLCPVKIIHHSVLFGTYDPTDPPEFANDQIRDCYYVRYLPPGNHNTWQDGGVALSMNEAIFLANRKLGPAMQWNT